VVLVYPLVVVVAMLAALAAVVVIKEPQEAQEIRQALAQAKEILVVRALLYRHFRAAAVVVLVLLVQLHLDQLLERGGLDRNLVLMEQRHTTQAVVVLEVEQAQQVDWVEQVVEVMVH